MENQIIDALGVVLPGEPGDPNAVHVDVFAVVEPSAEPARSPLPPLAAPDWTEEMDRLAEFLLYHHDPVAVERLAWLLLGLARQQQGVACRACRGRGQIRYTHSATWRGGMGVDGLYLDVCDVCWGTGRTDRTGTNLRAQQAELQRREQESSSRWLKQRLGAECTSSMRESFPLLADRLRRLKFSRDSHYRSFWAGETAALLADVLEEMARGETIKLDDAVVASGGEQ